MGTTKADVERANQRRQRVIDYLADMLTDPACPLEVNDLGHFRLAGTWFAAAHDDKPQLRDEVLLSVVVEALDRLLA